MANAQELLIKMIKTIPLFSTLNNEEILNLSNKFSLKFYPKNTLIIKEGTIPENIYILKSWLLEARKSKWFSYIVLGQIKPGEIFWEMSYFLNSEAVADVIALEDSNIWEIKREDFEEFLKKYPEKRQEIEKIVQKRLKENEWKNITFSQQNDIDDINIVL